MMDGPFRLVSRFARPQPLNRLIGPFVRLRPVPSLHLDGDIRSWGGATLFETDLLAQISRKIAEGPRSSQYCLNLSQSSARRAAEPSPTET
ncbi:bsr2110 [Bradyrhizobium diazoefficiens USDA 110]|uniref:Bsr2110 protein n=1 Tax=Bradyrhizobium diazoefficiens (strain JCM 10833 / BCRC 13528 / IAM 13628 / NBRC 14792 / USDA 110) TaxID=224911 RepID=Q89TC8_BRADU|nr:hypothetical protein AAV28_07390 [Bradyrhizobium diazoefficiens USDA 110]PDT55574.1 hypothetical protein CO678_43190 [Bradyrhizobium diazoefficiens]QBP20945.1 hypothetical protein Bdiaspc4_10765 [Bradyrhizobium diazoefficiens]BAC47375.1 bsr2110 [Bradyrhizobium diazoefficiens USDA 110]